MFVLKWRGGKLKTPVVKQKSFELERKGGHSFFNRLEKGTIGLFFALEGKIELKDANFGEKNGLKVQVFRNNALQP